MAKAAQSRNEPNTRSRLCDTETMPQGCPSSERAEQMAGTLPVEIHRCSYATQLEGIHKVGIGNGALPSPRFRQTGMKLGMARRISEPTITISSLSFSVPDHPIAEVLD